MVHHIVYMLWIKELSGFQILLYVVLCCVKKNKESMCSEEWSLYLCEESFPLQFRLHFPLYYIIFNALSTILAFAHCCSHIRYTSSLAMCIIKYSWSFLVSLVTISFIKLSLHSVILNFFSPLLFLHYFTLFF